MKIIQHHEKFALACKGAEKFGMYISFPAVTNVNGKKAKEILKAAPYLQELSKRSIGDFVTILLEGEATFFFDTLEEVQEMFHLTVGDDGPTKTNPYDGPCTVFALTCDNKGNLMSENT